MPSHLVVTVDTEEEGLWGGNYPRTENTVENIRGVERFQTLCDRFGIRPTYLVDAPVVEEDWAVDLLRGIQDDGRCEIGTHVHPWCNPPFEEETTPRNSYLCNLPEALQRDKIVWLTERIEQRFGRRPTSFRAGRYGLDIVGARILDELGYEVDSSVIPFQNYSPEGGPDFSRAPWTPYFVGGDDLRVPQSEGNLLEVPVCVGFNRRDFRRAQAIQKFVSSRWLRHGHVEGILDRLGVIRRIKFSPEQADAAMMRKLVNVCLAQQMPVMVMMLHSSSLVPGYSPYVRNDRQADRFFETLSRTFHHCLEPIGMITATLTGLSRTRHGDRVPA